SDFDSLMSKRWVKPGNDTARSTQWKKALDLSVSCRRPYGFVLRLYAGRKHIVKPMAGAGCLGGKVATVFRIDLRMQCDARADLDAAFHQCFELAGIVRQELNAICPDHLEHARRHPIIALVVIEAEHHVGVHGVEPIVLKRVSPHLVCEPQAAPLLLEVEHDSPAGCGQLRHCKLELRPAVASARSEHITGKAGRMHPHIDGFRKVGFAKDDSDRARPDRVPEHAESGGGAI